MIGVKEAFYSITLIIIQKATRLITPKRAINYHLHNIAPRYHSIGRSGIQTPDLSHTMYVCYHYTAIYPVNFTH